MTARPTQPSSDLRAQLGALASLGYDADRLRAEAGVTRDDLDDPDERFPFEVSATVQRAAMAERPLSHVGLRLAASVPFGPYDVVDYLVYSCDGVRDGLERLARYFATVTQAVSLHVEDHGLDEVRFVIRDASAAHRLPTTSRRGAAARRRRLAFERRRMGCSADDPSRPHTSCWLERPLLPASRAVGRSREETPCDPTTFHSPGSPPCRSRCSRRSRCSARPCSLRTRRRPARPPSATRSPRLCS